MPIARLRNWREGDPQLEENGIGHVLGLHGIEVADRHLVDPQHRLGP